MENYVPEIAPTTNGNGELVELGKLLMNAARSGDVQTVAKCVQYGAPFATDWLGMTALHHAALRGQRDMVEVLMRAGIAKEPRSKVDKTPLHLACQEGHTDVARLLISHGADIDAVDMINMTPLHWAVQMNHFETVHVLLYNGADPLILNKFEKNCFEIAESNENEKILMLLKESPNTSRGSNVKNLQHVNRGKKKIYMRSATVIQAKETAKKNSLQKDTENEVWQYLEDHGIEMLEGEDVNLVAAAIGSGQSVYVTEAGKQALHLTEGPNKETTPLVHVNITQPIHPPKSTSKIKRPISPKSDCWTHFLRLNAKYTSARRAAKQYRTMYLQQKQAALVFKRKLVDCYKAIKAVNELEINLQYENSEVEQEDDDDDDDDDVLLEEESEIEQDLELT